MKNNIFLLPIMVGFSTMGFSQVGINTEAPKTVLHIEASSKTNPKTTDGILIPKFKNFPEVNPNVRGMLAFLEGNATQENNFYFFDGEKWIPFYANVSKDLDETIYSFNGEGATFTTAGIAGTLNFSQFNKKTDDGFAIQGADTIKIGKKGTYLVQLSSSFKRTSSNTQSNMLYYIDVNSSGTTRSYEGSIGYPLEGSAGQTGTSITYSFITDLQVGDLISVRFSGTRGFTYTPFGTNNLTLTYIHD